MLRPPPGLRHVPLGIARDSIRVHPHGIQPTDREALQESLEGMQVHTHCHRHNPARLDPGRE
jgi:hypothetical protein